MTYKFVDRYPRTNDVIDYDEINKHMGDIAEVLTGGLNEHNFAEEEMEFDDTSLYAFRYRHVRSDLGYGYSASGVPHNKPPDVITQYDAQAVMVDNSGSWVSIDSVEFSTDNTELLHIVAQASYCWTGWDIASSLGVHNHMHTKNWNDSGSYSDQPWEPPRVQLALRVNGSIYGLTGNRNPYKQPHLPIKADPSNQVLSTSLVIQDNTSPWPGMLQLHANHTAGPGHALMAVAMNELVPVPPGYVKVEIVARRLSTLKSMKFAINDVIAITTRQIAVISYPVNVNRSRFSTPIEFVPIDKATSATQTLLNTNMLQRIKTRVNDLEADDITKLNRFHYPAPLIKSSGGVLQSNHEGYEYTSSLTISNWCPGETDPTFETSTTGGSFGWTPLTVGGTEWKLKATSGAIPTNTESGYILLRGQLHVKKINKNLTNFYQENNEEQFQGLAGIYYYRNGAYNLIETSVVPISRRTTPLADANVVTVMATGTIFCELPVPLMAILDTGGTPQPINHFGICVSVVNWAGTAQVDMEITGMHLTYEYYKE